MTMVINNAATAEKNTIMMVICSGGTGTELADGATLLPLQDSPPGEDGGHEGDDQLWRM